MDTAGTASLPEVTDVDHDAASLESKLAALDAAGRVRHVLDHLSSRPLLSSSFGAQAALALHMITRESPGIPVVLIDTGYLFPETYRFIDELTERLRLNLHVYRAETSPVWFEARHGRLWEQGRDGIERYNELRKVEPMRKALAELHGDAWFAGLRRRQSRSRQQTPIIERRNGLWKVHPFADWSDRDVGEYLRRHRLPYHPLWEAGYMSIGDTHTSAPLQDGESAENTRFFGLQRECGLHTRI